MNKQQFLPMTLLANNKKVLIVGGGKAAFKKCKKLLLANMQVTVIAPKLNPDFTQYHDKFIYIDKEISASDIDDYFIVIAATNYLDINQNILNWARAKNILAINIDKNWINGDCIFPATFSNKEILVSVSTYGKNCRQAIKIKKIIANILDLDFINLANTKIKVVSCGLGKISLTTHHLNAIYNADIIVGAKRLLNLFNDLTSIKIHIDTEIIKKLDEVFIKYPNKKIVILASGDSLFYGIGALLAKRFTHDQVQYIPNTTSVQVGAAKLGLVYSELNYYSVHGRSKKLPIAQINNSPLVCILCDSINNPWQIAQDLIAYNPNNRQRKCVICQNLGLPEETLNRLNLGDILQKTFANLTFIFILQEGQSVKEIALGLPDDLFYKDSNCITHPEIRAVVLSKLKLKPHSILWDLGAGSGSVGLEACTIANELTVYSVEKSAKRCQNIIKNSVALGINNLTAIEGDIFKTMPNLPKAQSVFIGGGGNDIIKIIQWILKSLPTGTRLVITAIMQETICQIINNFKNEISESLELQIRRQKKLGKGTMLENDNPIRIFCMDIK